MSHVRFKGLVVGTIVAAGIVGAGFSRQASAQEFSYNGDTGPGFWSELNPEWEACSGDGFHARQSPINIGKVRVDRHLGKLKLQLYPTEIDIFNNGHTIEQEYAETGSRIGFEGQDYELRQFHFHTLSEHTVKGRHGVMELHGVFQNDAGYLVVGQLFEVGGHRNALIQKLIQAGLPEKNGNTSEAGVEINLTEVLTSTKRYYSYRGSLTTPACTETVTWVVLAQPAKVTVGQYEAFRVVLGNNFRPLQDLNGRSIRGSRHLPRHAGKAKR